MTRRTQRIADLMHARNRIDAQLAQLGFFPAPDVVPVVQDWQQSAQQILDVLKTAPDVAHLRHVALVDLDNTPDMQRERREVLERDGAPVRKAS